MINDIRWTLRFRKGQYERKWCRSIPWHFYNKVYVMFYLLVSVMVWIYSSMELRVSPAAARISHIQFTASTALLIAMGITTVMLSRNGASAEPPEAPGSTIDQKTPAMVPEPSPLGSTVLNLPPPTHDRGEVLAYAYFGVHLVINTAFLWVICTGLNPNSLGLIGVYITSSIILPWICLTLFYQTKIARIWPLLAVTLISSNGSYGLIATTASSYSPNRISKISVYTVGTRPVVRSSDPISNNEPDSPRPFESLQSFDEPGPLAPRVGTQRDRNYLEEIAMVTERTLTDSNTIVRRKILFQSIFFSLLVVGLYGLRYAKEYSERMAFFVARAD